MRLPDRRYASTYFLSAFDEIAGGFDAIVNFYALEAERELAALYEMIATAYPEPQGIKFGRLAAEYGIYHYRALADWAAWALERIEQSKSGTAGEPVQTNPEVL